MHEQFSQDSEKGILVAKPWCRSKFGQKCKENKSSHKGLGQRLAKQLQAI